MHKSSILVLGDTGRTEFEWARTVPNDWGTVSALADPGSAATVLAEAEIVPDVIVVVQAFPGQFSHPTIDRLRRLAPVARMIGLMGSWCEGEMRTGTPWPGVVRTYWHQWPARGHRQFQRLVSGEGCSWTLPPTAAEEERLLADATECWPHRHGLVVICSTSQEMAGFLSAACRRQGFATLWQRAATAARVEGAAAVIFDAAQLGDDAWGELDRLAATLRPTPVIALLAFPRAEDDRRARSAGAAAVLSKPLAIDDLFWELERVAGSAG